MYKNITYTVDGEEQTLHSFSSGYIKFLNKANFHTDEPFYKSLDHLIEEQVYPEFDVHMESGAFGYEYGSIVGTHDPGPIVEVYWENDRPIVNGVVANFEYDPEDFHSYEFEFEKYEETVYVDLDFSEVEITELTIPYDEGEYSWDSFYDSSHHEVKWKSGELSACRLKGKLLLE